MNQKISFSESSDFKTIDCEQTNQIIDAILAGKYSWACFLLLRCMGYDPLHYIPYRTYNRLVKEHCQASKLNKLDTECPPHANSKVVEFSASDNYACEQDSKITDLEYLEKVARENTPINGGSTERSLEPNSIELNLILHVF